MSLSAWILAARPKTLPAAISPVVIGTAMAFGDGIGYLPSAVAALLAALLIQIGTNFVNDYCDFKKGADVNRVGPVRVTQAGLLSPQQVCSAAILMFILAAGISVYLYFRAGLPILIIGITSILSGIFYTAGRKSLGYLGLGDIFVFIFFGPVAVGGTYYVQSLEMNSAVIVAGLAPGFLSMAILAVNNLRDADTDRTVGKKTLAVRFGKDFARSEYVACILGAVLTPCVVYLITDDHAGVFIACFIGFLSIASIRQVMTKEGAILNNVLANTGQILVVYSILFSAGWLWASH